jgi:hypothetical protein
MPYWRNCLAGRENSIDLIQKTRRTAKCPLCSGEKDGVEMCWNKATEDGEVLKVEPQNSKQGPKFAGQRC